MKKNIKYSIFGFVIALGACTSEDIMLNNPTKTELGTIKEIELIASGFDCEGHGDSRTVIEMGDTNIENPVWAENDTIGIYPATGDQLSFPIVDGVGTSTCVFNGGGWALKKSTSYTAYSPFNRQYYRKNSNELPISMLGQKQVGNDNSSHLGAYDIQIAKGTTPSSGKISFAFEHKVAIVRMDLVTPRAGEWTSVALESEGAFTTKAKMDLTKEIPEVIPTATSSSVELVLENVKTTTDDRSLVVYMMMLPVNLTGKSLNVKLTDKLGNVYETSASVVNDKYDFKASSARWITAHFNEAHTYHVETAGKLSSLVSSSLKYSILSLKLSGNLNCTDFAFIRDMAGISNKGKKTAGVLKSLDISQCNIVTGAKGFYTYNKDFDNADGTEGTYGYCTVKTINNILPSHVFSKTNLTSVILPTSITEIEYGAFWNSKLQSVTIPNSVTSINTEWQNYGEHPYGYSEIENIYVANDHPTFSSIDGILYDKSGTKLLACPGGKKSITIPNGVLSVANGAFSRTMYLTNTEFLNKIKNPFSYRLFYRSNITSAVIPIGVTEIGSDVFYKCYNLSSVEIPEGITRIYGGNFAFSALKTVTLPSTLKEIDFDAFLGISTLKEVHCKAITPPWCSDKYNTFGGASKENCTLYVPAGSLNAYKSTDVWKDFSTIKEEFK